MSVLNSNSVAGQKVTSSKRLNAIAEKLAADIETARLLPERKLSIQGLAKWLRTTPEAIETILPAFLESKLLLQYEDEFIVPAIDYTGLIPRLDERLPLEQRLAYNAALNASSDDVTAMQALTALMKRCAVIGDIDGYMLADRQLEVILGIASKLPDESERLKQIKREFRRAWLACNRLRDLGEPAELRHALVESIAARDSEQATKAVAKFIEYLRRSL